MDPRTQAPASGPGTEADLEADEKQDRRLDEELAERPSRPAIRFRCATIPETRRGCHSSASRLLI